MAASLLALSAAAQTQNAVITGSVTDRTGAPVSGLPLALAKADGAVVAEAISTTRGEITLGGVPPGDYVIAIPAYRGFAAQERPLHVAGNAVLKLVLQPETLNQAIDVASDTSVSTEAIDNKDSIVVSAESLQHLPVFDQNIIATLTPFLDPSTLSSSGVSILVDGIEMKTSTVTASAISEVRINQDPYSAEFSSPGRGRIEITTKPGTPVFHGTLNFIARDATFNGRNYFAPTRPAEQRRIYEGHLSGPVGRNGHTTFLLSGARREEDLQASVHAFDVTGPIDLNAPTPTRESQITGRVTHDFSDVNRFSLAYNFEYATSLGNYVGGLVLPEAGVNQFSREDDLILNDRILVSPHLVQQLQITLEFDQDNLQSVTNARSVQVQGAITRGGAQADVFRTENTIHLSDVVSWTHGRHYIRFGVNMPQLSRRGVDDHTNRLGTFNFSSLADLANATPFQFKVQQGTGRAVYWINEVGSFAQDEISLRKNLQVTAGVRYQWQTYLNQYGNFAPRVSVAYAPSRKWIVRAGSGLFFDRTGGDFPVTFKLHNGVVLRQYQVIHPSYPDPLAPGQTFATVPTSLSREDPNLRAPYQVQYSATLEHPLTPGLVATATYRGLVGVASFRSRDANAPLAPDYTTRPNPALGFIQQVEAGGRSRLDALDLGLRGKIGTWFEGQAQYTYSHANNNTGGINWYPQDQQRPNAEWGRADTDRRQRFNLLGTIHPDHWLTLGIALALYTGTPYTQLAGNDFYNTGLGNARLAGVGRNTLEGGRTANLDLLWDHDFKLNHAKGEKARLLNVGLSAFNVLNHSNFTNFIGNVRSPLYQQATTAQAARQIQFSLRYQF